MTKITRKFKSDEHRKAIFANMFKNKVGKTSRVKTDNVRNFEVKSTKSQRMKPPKVNINVRGRRITLDDVKVKSEKEFCDMCKRRGLSLKSGKCKVCERETRDFTTNKRKRELTKRKNDVIKRLGPQGSTLTGFEGVGVANSFVEFLRDPKNEIPIIILDHIVRLHETQHGDFYEEIDMEGVAWFHNITGREYTAEIPKGKHEKISRMIDLENKKIFGMISRNKTRIEVNLEGEKLSFPFHKKVS